MKPWHRELLEAASNVGIVVVVLVLLASDWKDGDELYKGLASGVGAYLASKYFGKHKT